MVGRSKPIPRPFVIRSIFDTDTGQYRHIIINRATGRPVPMDRNPTDYSDVALIEYTLNKEAFSKLGAR